ncbi:UNVERIFIED_CONTAM: hypothetical protein Slati_2124300 [Sesamum latifolium]|uniref:Integrase catalytic domain-containing protein n=1 Tax=Sesamum latifolium TaxID=2727402 RepID=A0AAW2WTH8_9LAMI
MGTSIISQEAKLSYTVPLGRSTIRAWTSSGPSPQGQKKFVLVPIDHFTKWIEAESVAKITEHSVIQFVWKNLLCRFGVPSKITMDNGTQFQGSKFRAWCVEWKIKQIFTSVGNLKVNGQTEVSNRILLKNLKAKLGAFRTGWQKNYQEYCGLIGPPLGLVLGILHFPWCMGWKP